jgi:hypothetical protein
MTKENPKPEKSAGNDEEKLLYKFKKSEDQEVRMSEVKYKGMTLYDLRVYKQHPEGGFYYRTKQGITLRKDLMLEIKKAFSSL